MVLLSGNTNIIHNNNNSDYLCYTLGQINNFKFIYIELHAFILFIKYLKWN